MPLLSELVTRIQWYLQDGDGSGDGAVWQRAQIRAQLAVEAERLARKGLWGEAVGVQGVAGKATYALNEQSLLLASATQDGATSSLTVATSTAAAFSTLGVLPGDVVRNLTDGCQGIVTTVGSAILTCLGGFHGGWLNQMTEGDQFLVERPLSSLTVTGIQEVLYDGTPLLPMTERGLDALTPGWEQRLAGPKYWSMDNRETPTAVQITPAPVFDGSSVLVFPAVPLALPLARNFVMFVTVEPQQTYDEASVSAWPEVWEDVLVFQAVEQLLQSEGPWQNLSVGTVMGQLAALWRQKLGVP